VTATVDSATSHLFVSYASVDQNRVLAISAALERVGLRTWVDRSGIPGGVNYGPEIADAIKRSSAFLLVCSAAAFASRNVRQEIQIAWKHDRPIVPLLLQPVEIPVDLEYWLEGTQWIEVLDHPETEWLPLLVRSLDRLGIAVDVHIDPRSRDDRGAQSVMAGNLPAPAAPLVGRELDIATVSELIGRDEVRLVTLVGPGGVGKTRLSIAVAEDLRTLYRDGVWFVDLAPLADAELVSTTVAQVLGIGDQGQQSIADRLNEWLRDKGLLLLIDNFEHVLDAGSVVANILAHAPGVNVLTTSRTPLHLSGEHEVLVEPLAIPGKRTSFRAVDAAASPAVRLFVQRAEAVKPGFALTDENAEAIAAICARLDGLPLAIEIAAARIKFVSPRALLDRLQKRLPALTGGARDLPARQQTLRKAIAWSYDVLSIEEQTLLRRIGVFAAGCTVEAADDVANSDGSIDTFDSLASLVDKSLLRQGEVNDEPRFQMLEMIREFALEQLDATGEAEGVRSRHAQWCLRLAEQAEREFFGPNEIAWLDRCEAELGNLRAALDWSTSDGGDPVLGLRLGGALWWFWLRRVGIREGRERLEQAFEHGRAAPVEVRAKALATAGQLGTFQADYRDALARLDESLTLYRSIDEPFGLARTQFFLGDHWQARGEADLAIPPLENALAGFRTLGAMGWEGCTLYYLASAASLKHEYERGRALAAEALSVCRQAEFRSGVAMTLGHLGTLALRQQDHEGAEQYFREALALRRDLDDRYGMANQITDLAYLAAARSEAERAVMLAGAASALREAIGAEIDAANRADHNRLIASLRDTLGNDRFEELWSAGYALTPDQASALDIR
jgi:predicted ATPase